MWSRIPVRAWARPSAPQMARHVAPQMPKQAATPMTTSLAMLPPNLRASGVRHFSMSAPAFHGHLHKPNPGEELHITFITKDGTQHTFEVAEGDNILDIAQANNLDMEGACGGLCACSTCHIIVDPDFYDEIPEPDDDENDMLDLAFGLTETSRLGCQVKMSKELDGLRVALPAMTRNLQSKDFS